MSWKPILLICIFLVFLAVFPQINLRIQRGEHYNGSAAYYNVDEPAYAAYIKSLIDGKTRKNNPYTGQEHISEESLFSIQFAPAYLIAIPSQHFQISVEMSLILVSIFSAVFTGLTVYWLVEKFSGDSLVASIGTLSVLIFGTIFAGQGALKEILGFGDAHIFFPFLRWYVPSIVMPCFFLLFGLVWIGLQRKNNSKTRVLACLTSLASFNVLLYSYFYLWSAILAWLGVILILYIILFYSNLKKGNLVFLVTLFSLCLISLIPYFLLVMQMKSSSNIVVLEPTRAPILLNPTLLASYVFIFFALIVSITKKLILNNNFRLMFAASFLLLPVVVFNQQLITGYSMQPFHYSRYVANYTILLGLGILLNSLFRGFVKSHRLTIALISIPLICGWGIVELAYATSHGFRKNNRIDQSRPVNEHLMRVANEGQKRQQTTLNFDPLQAELQPVVASQPVLWTHYISAFGNLSVDEHRSRFFKYLYFTGMSPQQFEIELRRCPNSFVCTPIFAWRFNPTLTIGNMAPKSMEIEEIIGEYKSFYNGFDKSNAYRPFIGFAIARRNRKNNFFNLDLWYERGNPKYFGEFVLYSLKSK